MTLAKEKEQEQDIKMQELLDRIDAETATLQELLKQIEKLQQDKYILTALITELDVNVIECVKCQNIFHLL